MNQYYGLMTLTVLSAIFISIIVIFFERRSSKKITSSDGELFHTDAVGTNPMLIVARHAVGVMAASVPVALALYRDDWLQSVLAINILVFGISLAICGLALLFFTKREKGKFHKSFIYSIWTVLVLIVIGSFY